MAFALIENGQITTYPLNVREYLHENRISAPTSKYQEIGIYEVRADAYPAFNRYTEKVVAAAPVYDATANEVTQAWVVEPMSAAELSEFDELWSLETWRVSWALRRHHWDRDLWDPVETYLQAQHTAGADSEYADFATFLDRTTITWTAFVSAYQVIQSTAVLAGVTITLPTVTDLRAAWQEAETYTAAY